MSDVKWIKIIVSIFDDEKIKFIETMPNGDEMIVIWFKILCLAGKSNSFGFLMMTDKIAYTEEMLSSIFNRDIKTIQLSLQTFEKLDMIEIEDNRISITNWEKHQNIDGLEKIREQNRIRQRRFKERNNQKKIDNAIGNVTGNATVTQGNATDKEKEIDKELDKDKEKKERKKTSFDVILDELNDDDLKNAFLEFIKMRKLIKKPLTDNALKLSINKLFKLSNDKDEMIEIINQSIMNSWQSFYPLKEEKKESKDKYFKDDLAF